MSDKEIIGLKEHFAMLLDEREKHSDERFQRVYDKIAALEKAFIEFKATTEKRLENTNEWRHAFDDLTDTKVGRTEFEPVARKVEKIENMKQGGLQAWGILVGGIGVFIAFLAWAMKILGK